MISFLQTDPRLIPVIQKYGCAFLSSHYLLPDDLTPEQCNDRWSIFQQQGVAIDANNEIFSWARLLAGIYSGESVYRFPFSFSRKVQDRSYLCDVSEREILKWHLDTINEDHFTVGDGKGNTAWDSMGRPDVMALPTTHFVEKVIVTVG